MSPIVLASTSPYRRQLLERLGLAFDCEAPRCDEEALKDPALPPLELARHLARAKAASVADLRPEAIVIGSDQLAHVDGLVLGKPGTRAAAIEQLLRLAGRTHELVTAVHVIERGQIHEHVDRTRLHMRTLDRAAIERYVDADQPLACAGSYKIEGRGIALFEAIESADHSAITGLPLLWLTAVLADLGIAIP